MKSTQWVTKLLASIAAFAIALGIGLGAMVGMAAAADNATNNTLTLRLKNGVNNRYFRVYRLLGISSVDANGNVTPTERDTDHTKAIEDGVNTVKGDNTATDFASAFNGLTSIKSDTDAARTFGNAAYKSLVDNNVTPDADYAGAAATDITVSGNNIKFSNLPYGYYLVEEYGGSTAEGLDRGSFVMLDTIAAADGSQVNKTIDVKSESPSSSKVIDGGKAKDPVFARGDTITYDLTYTIPANFAQDFKDKKAKCEFTLQDWLSEGLDFNEVQSVTVGTYTITDNAPTNGTGNTAPTTEGYGMSSSLFTPPEAAGTYLEWAFAADYSNDVPDVTRSNNVIQIPTSYLSTTDPTVVTVQYTAKLNGNAIVESTGNPNNYNVKYSRNPDSSSEYSYTPVDTPRVYTLELNVTKVDATNTSKTLTGAQFCLNTTASSTGCLALTGSAGSYVYDSSVTTDTTTTLDTDKNGKLSITGLDAGTYYLVETKAPSGYKAPDPADSPVYVIAADSTQFTDNDGIYLPSGSATTPIAVTVTASSGDNNAYVGQNSTGAQIVKNYQQGSLPLTGGAGIVVFVIAGLAVIGVGIGFIVSRSRKARH